jgi:amidohydrolase
MGRDPIVTAAEAVVNLQMVVSREVDPTDSVVVTVGKINGGSGTNIIPDEATIEGTARTLTPESRRLVQQAIRRRVEHVAMANGCTAEFSWMDGYPPTINDPAMSDYVRAVSDKALGVDRFIPIGRASMGGEDFAYYLEKKPGCFFLVGVQPDRERSYPPLHSDRYDFTDGAMDVGMTMFLGLVKSWGGKD